MTLAVGLFTRIQQRYGVILRQALSQTYFLPSFLVRTEILTKCFSFQLRVVLLPFLISPVTNCRLTDLTDCGEYIGYGCIYGTVVYTVRLYIRYGCIYGTAPRCFVAQFLLGLNAVCPSEVCGGHMNSYVTQISLGDPLTEC